MVAAAIIGGAVASVGSAVIGSKAAGDAADAQSDAAKDANATQLAMYNQTRTDQEPWRVAGGRGLTELQRLLGLSGDAKSAGYGSLSQPFTSKNLASDPGYQFELQQGQQAQQRAASAAGRNLSGATLKALSRYGTNYAGTKFNEAFNRDQVADSSLYNKLAGISQTGQVSANQVGMAGQNYANQYGDNVIGASNARAAAGIGQAQTWANATNQGISALTGANWGSGTNAFTSPDASGAYANPVGDAYDMTGGVGLWGYGG